MSSFVSLISKNRILPFFLVVLVLAFTACPKESECDTAGYALPEIELIEPEFPDFEVNPDTLFTLRFLLKAEAGLNTLSMNGEPLYVYTGGETEKEYELTRYFWEDREYLFVLHDLCDRSVEISLNMTVVYPYN